MVTTSCHDPNHGFTMPHSQLVRHLAIRYRRDADDNSAVPRAIFRRCVISSQECAFRSFIALLSVFFLLSEGMSSSVALLWCSLRCPAEYVIRCAVGYLVHRHRANDLMNVPSTQTPDRWHSDLQHRHSLFGMI